MGADLGHFPDNQDMIVHDDFRSELRGIDLDALDGLPDVIYGLRSDLTIGMVSSSWASAAGSLRPAELPRGSVVDSLPGGLRVYYTQLYQGVLETGEPAEHLYLCPTPSHYRRFRMTCTPLQTGILVVHRLLEKRPHRLRAFRPNRSKYTAADGFITMCAHCRQVQRSEDLAKWDWVPEWVRREPPKVTHGVCDPCMETYYSELSDAAG